MLCSSCESRSTQRGYLIREIQEAGYMIVRVPVYGGTNAGRNLYLLFKEIAVIPDSLNTPLSCRRVGNALRSPLYSCRRFFWAAYGKGKHAIQHLSDRVRIGCVEQDKFRSCGREYVQHQDGTTEINCRDNTRAIRPIDIPKGEKPTMPVTATQRTVQRSVVGSVAWVPELHDPTLRTE